MTPRLIEAKFPGRCADCGDRIHVGDLIGFNHDGKAICEDCRVEMAEESYQSLLPYMRGSKRGAKEEICPICHLTKPCDH